MPGEVLLRIVFEVVKVVVEIVFEIVFHIICYFTAIIIVPLVTLGYVTVQYKDFCVDEYDNKKILLSVDEGILIGLLFWVGVGVAVWFYYN